MPGKSLALVGLAGVGKDTLAAHIADVFGHQPLSFAAPLKRAVRALYAFSDAQLFGPSKLRNEPDPRYPRDDGTCLTPREALERFGTDAGRKCYPRTWLDLAMADAQLAESQSASWVFTDCRFTNEIDACRSRGALIVRLVRAGKRPCDHASEQEQHAIPDAYFDFVLSTDGAIQETRDAFDRWFQSVQGGSL